MRRRAVDRRVAVVAVAVFLTSPGLFAWTAERVDGTRGVQSVDLEIGPGDAPAVVFGDTRLVYATRQGPSWSYETVLETSCMSMDEVSLVHDDGGRPLIGFRANLYFAHVAWHDGSDWRTERIGGDFSGGRIDVAYDRAGRPAALFGNSFTRGAVVLTRHDGSEWRDQAVADGGFVDMELEFDPEDGEPIILFSFGSAIQRVTHDGVAWTLEPLPTVGAARYFDLALDGAGRPAVAYAEDGGPVRLLRFDGAAWSLEEVAPSGDAVVDQDVALTFDAAGSPLVGFAYDDGRVREQRLARRDGSDWAITTVDAVADANKMAVAIDGSGLTHVAYNSFAGTELRYAQAALGPFVGELVETGAGVRPGTDIALDAVDLPAVAYIDWAAGSVMLARTDGERWNRQRIVTHGAGTADASIAFDPGGFPAVAYRALDSLRLARFDGARWTESTVDPRTRSGALNDLGFDAAGRPAVSYERDGRLWLARFDGAAWDIEEIDVDGPVESATALHFTSTGLPVIAYTGRLSRTYRVAWFDGSDWTIETVSAIDTWSRVGLALDSSDRAVVSYGGDAVRLARFDGASWSYDRVDDGESRWTALVLEPSGYARVAYEVDGGVRVAREDAAGFAVEDVDSTPDRGHTPSLAIDGRGQEWVAHVSECREDLYVARGSEVLTLYRGTVAAIVPGWKPGVLPLAGSTDDETPPFPLATSRTDTPTDALAASDPLVVYRVLGAGERPIGNVLRAAKVPTGVVVSF